VTPKSASKKGHWFRTHGSAAIGMQCEFITNSRLHMFLRQFIPR
jgi:hypothetical protein